MSQIFAGRVGFRGRKPGPSPKPARAGPGFGPEYVGPGRASGRKVLIASGLVGPGLPCAFEFRLIYIIKTQLLCVCLCVCLFVRIVLKRWRNKKRTYN